MLPTSLLVLIASIVGPALCQTVQDDWLSPLDAEIWYTGEKNTISWDSNLQDFFDYYCPACDTSNVDLWITGTADNFFLVQAGVNVQTEKSIDWTVPNSFEADRWVFRFIPAGTKWSDGGEEISGSVFQIRVTQTTTSSSMSSTSTSMSSLMTTSTKTGTTSSTNPTSTTSSPATSSHNHSGELSTGAKAGIGIGAAIGAIALFTLGFFLARRQQRSKAAAAGGAYSQASSSAQQYPPQYPQSTQTQYGQPAAYTDQPPYTPQPSPWSQGSAYQQPQTEPAEMMNNEPMAEMGAHSHVVELPAKR